MCALAMMSFATQAQDDVLYDISTTPATAVEEGHIYLLANRAYPEIGLVYDSNGCFATTFEPVSEQLGQSVTSDQPFFFTATADGITLPVTLININDNGEMGYGNAGGGQVLSPRRNAAASDETTYFTVKDQDGQLAMLTYNVEDEYCDLYGVIYGGENTTPAECAQWIAYEVTEHEHQWAPNEDRTHYCTVCYVEEEHSYVDGVCEICEHECRHISYIDGECEYCGKKCEHPAWENVDDEGRFYCIECGYECHHSGILTLGHNISVADISYDDFIGCLEYDEVLPGIAFEITCETCGKQMTQDDPDIVRVSRIKDLQIESEPTCTEEGRYSFGMVINLYYEDACLYTITPSESIEGNILPRGHNKVNNESLYATCTERGSYGGTHCSECNTVIDEPEIVEPLGHDFGSTPIEVADGLYAYVCGNDDSHRMFVNDSEEGGNFVLTATTDDETGTTTYAADATTTVEIADGVSFTTPVDFTATGNQVIIDRRFTEDTPATINLPFDVDASVMGEKYYTFGGIALNAVTGKWEATMNEAAGTLLANTPYIVLPEGTTLGINNTATVTFRADASGNSSTTSGDWKMVSSVAKKVWSDDENADEIGKTYGFAGKSLTNDDGVEIEAGQFVKVVAGAWIPAGRAYLTYKDGSDPTAASHAPARTADAALPASISVRFVNADGTNGIGTLNTESGHMTIDAWYDLQGRRISEPKQGGIYIRNNKKITVK